MCTDDDVAVLDAASTLIDLIGRGAPLELVVCPAVVRVDRESALFVWRDWEEQTLEHGRVDASLFRSFLESGEPLQVVGPEHSTLRPEAFATWYDRQPTRTEADCLDEVRPIVVAGDIGSTILSTYLQPAVFNLGEGAAIAALTGHVEHKDLWDPTSDRDATECWPDPREFEAALIKAAEKELSESILHMPDDSNVTIGRIVRDAALDLLSHIQGRPGLGSLVEALEEPVPDLCRPTWDGLGEIDDSIREAIREETRLVSEHLAGALARIPATPHLDVLPEWKRKRCRTHLLADRSVPLWGGLEAPKDEKPSRSQPFGGIRLLEPALDRMSAQTQSGRDLLALAARLSVFRSQNPFWPFDPTNDFVLVRVSDHVLVLEAPRPDQFETPEQRLVATRQLLAVLRNLVPILSAGDRLPPLAPPTWRTNSELPTPLALLAYEFLSEHEPENHVRRAFDILVVANRLLGTIGAAEVSRTDESNRVQTAKTKVTLERILALPTEGDWATLATWMGDPARVRTCVLPHLQESLRRDAELTQALRRLIEIRNPEYHSISSVGPSAVRLLSRLEPLVHVLLRRVASALRSYALITAEEFLPDREGGARQRLRLWRGRLPDVVYVPADTPVLVPGQVGLLHFDTGQILPLAPFLIDDDGEIQGLHKWTETKVSYVPLMHASATHASEDDGLQKKRARRSTAARASLTPEQLSQAFPYGWLRIPRGDRLVNRYEVIEHVGTGGFAEVYRGHDHMLQTTIAIKVLHDHIAQQTGYHARLHLEAQLQMQIEHPSILRVYDSQLDHVRDLRFLVLEYAEGGDLEQSLRQGPVGSADQLEILKRIAGALAAIHQAGSIHRDVKPANVMRAGGQWKLGDFGVAYQQLSARFTRRAIHTTPEFSAPEALDFSRAPSPALDVYMFGRLAMALELGRAPHLNEGPESVADLPWVGVIERCCQRRPEDRYRDGREVMAALG